MFPRPESDHAIFHRRAGSLRRRVGAFLVVMVFAGLPGRATALAAETDVPGGVLLDTDPSPSGSLTLDKGRMRHAVGRDNGSLRISGILDARDQAATFSDRVLADQATMQVRDGGAFAADLRFVGCATLRRSLRCKSPDRGVQVSFRASDQPNVYKVTVTAKKLPPSVTGVPQPSGPITALLSDGAGTERPGTLSDCEKSGRHALRCKH